MGTSSTNNGGCSVDFLKCVLSVFNIIFLVAGVAVLAIAIWTIKDRYQYVHLLSTITYPVITYFLLSAGAFVLFVALLGFCSVYKDNRPLLLFYLFSLLLIFLMEAMVGIIGFFYYEQVSNDLKFNLNDTFMTEYQINTVKTDAIDYLQENFQCCGAVRYSDWKYSKWRKDGLNDNNMVPDSCCKSVISHCGRRDHPSNINDVGCMDKMESHMKRHLLIISSVGLGICIIQLFGIIYSCCLYCKLARVK